MSEEGESLFGYERVAPSVKTARVRGVFDSVADRYDIMNDLMSAGLHRVWKRAAVELLDVRPGQNILDLACGTADLARLIARRSKHQARIVCSDMNDTMLQLGRDKLINSGVVKGTAFVQANAESLPLPSNSMDRVVIGFGLRNVTHKTNALTEIERVLRPGGRVVVLEFSQPRSQLLAGVYEQYSFKILPRLGALVAGDSDSYRYLAESIRVHPDQEALKIMMQRAGFESVRYHNYLTGIVAIHIGFKA